MVDVRIRVLSVCFCFVLCRFVQLFFSLPGRTGGLFMHFWPMSLLPIWDRQCTYLLSYGLCYVSMESLFLSYEGLPICSSISEAVRVAWALGRLAPRLCSFLLSVVQQPWLCHDCNSFALVTTWALSSSCARLCSRLQRSGLR